jgi:hypothetical protein
MCSKIIEMEITTSTHLFTNIRFPPHFDRVECLKLQIIVEVILLRYSDKVFTLFSGKMILTVRKEEALNLTINTKSITHNDDMRYSLALKLVNHIKYPNLLPSRHDDEKF